MAERLEDARGQGGRGGVGLNSLGSPIASPESRDSSFQQIQWMREPLHDGELRSPPLSALGGLSGGMMDQHAGIEHLDHVPTLIVLFGTTDNSQPMDDASWSDPINRRDNTEAESRFEWSPASPLRDLGFTDYSADRGAFDFGTSTSPQLAGQFAAVSLVADDLAERTDGGLIELPSKSPSDIDGSLVPRQFSYSADSDAVEFFSLRRFNGGELQSTQSDLWLRKPAPSPDMSLAESLTTNNAPRSKAAQIDGGWVELNADGQESPIVLRRAPKNSLWSGSSWLDAPRRVRDSFWLEFGETLALRSEADVAQQWNSESVASDTSQLADPAVLAESDREDGGMIELIAAAHSNIDHHSPPSMNSSNTPRETPEKVRMDTGVGLFQMFEIATSPQGMNKEGDLSANQGAPFAEATTVIVTDAAPPSEQAAAMADKPGAEPIRAASLSGLLAAASLLFNRRKDLKQVYVRSSGL